MSGGPAVRWRWPLGVAALALALRLPRALLRWDEVSIAYAAYADPAARLVAEARWWALPQAWVGLHPPLHAALLGLGERFAPVPALALGFSALCSAAACAVLAARFGPLAGLLLATSAASIEYSSEINNYPLAALGVAAALAGARARPALRNLGLALAAWSHVLGLGLAGALSVAAARRAGPRALPVLAGGALIAAPVLVGALLRAGQDSTFAQPAVDLGGWASGALAVLRPAGLVQAALLVGLAVAPGAQGGPALRDAGLGVAGIGLLYVAFVGAGVAAAHQYPYLSLLVVPVAGLAAAAPGRSAAAALVALGLAQAGPLVVADLARLNALRADLARPRAVDAALSAARCGDLLWLVAPALQADDDKTDHSAVLWRISPLRLARRAVASAADPTDWRFGHPRWTGGLELRTSTELAWAPLDAALAQAGARGADAYIVLYDHAPAAGLDERLRLALRAWPHEARYVGEDRGLGVDLLVHVPPPTEAVRAAPAVAGCAPPAAR